MVLIMIPIGLVAAFAIAIALMTTVLRKIREIGLLVAMGGTRISVGMIFCMQGFIIGALGAFLGCCFALLFIRYRDSLMSFIVTRIAGEEGQAEQLHFKTFTAWKFLTHGVRTSLTTFLIIIFAVLVLLLLDYFRRRAARMNPAESCVVSDPEKDSTVPLGYRKAFR